MTGRHERAALDRIQTAASNRIVQMAGDAQDAWASLLLDSDILAGLRDAGALVLALDALADHATEAAARLRVAMAAVMADTGVPSLAMPHHVISYVEPRPKPVVTDEAALPREMFTTPAPRPDMQRIGAAMKAGPVPGVTMSNGGAGHVRISPKKERAA